MSEAETVSVHQQFPTPCFPGVQTLCMVAHLETKHLGISQANIALPWFVSQHTSKNTKAVLKCFMCCVVMWELSLVMIKVLA